MVPNPADPAGNGTWVEEGQGSLRLVLDAQTGRFRMLMLKEGTKATLLNQFVHWESALMPAQSEDGNASRAFVVQCEDSSARACTAPKRAPCLTLLSLEP